MSSRTAERIVVGVDGSDSSKAALAWAVRQAALTGGTVEAVMAWHYPVTAAGGPVAPLPVPPGADFSQEASRDLAAAITATVGPGRLVTVTPVVRAGWAAQVLLAEAKEAGLLVVGNRGHGGFTEALLGSVSQECVRHASCPVVIVRAGTRQRADGHN